MQQAIISTLTPGTRIMYRERTATVLEHTPIGASVQLTGSIPDRQFGATNNWRKVITPLRGLRAVYVPFSRNTKAALRTPSLSTTNLPAG